MDDEQISIGQLEADDLQRNAVPIGSQEQDEVRLRGIDGVERALTVVDNEARPIVGDTVASGRSSEADGHIAP